MNSTVQDFRIQGVTEEADINMHVDGGSSCACHTRPQDTKNEKKFQTKIHHFNAQDITAV